MIAIDDRGLLLGDGLFETVLWENGALEAFDAHAARLIAGCAILGLPAPDPSGLRIAAERAVADARLSDARAAVRLTWTAGSGGRGLDRPTTLAPRLIASAAPAPKPTTPARVVISTVRRNEGSPASRLKTLTYLDNVLARQEARAAGADDAILLNNRGEIACASAANVFWFSGDTLLTPALGCGALAGIMRARVIARANAANIPVGEVRETPECLRGASGVFLTNSLIGLRPISRLGDRDYPRHPLMAAFDADAC